MSDEQCLKYLDRDYRAAVAEEHSRHKGTLSDLALAVEGGQAILARFPDQVIAFDLARAVIDGLSEAGIVFASFTGRFEECEESDDPA